MATTTADLDDLNWLIAHGQVVTLHLAEGDTVALTLAYDPSDVAMRGSLGDVLAKAKAFVEIRERARARLARLETFIA
jgi:hypothetical protein